MIGWSEVWPANGKGRISGSREKEYPENGIGSKGTESFNSGDEGWGEVNNYRHRSLLGAEVAEEDPLALLFYGSLKWVAGGSWEAWLSRWLCYGERGHGTRFSLFEPMNFISLLPERDSEVNRVRNPISADTILFTGGKPKSFVNLNFLILLDLQKY